LTNQTHTLTSRERADLIAAAADDRRALDIVTLDLQGVTLIADFFVICSGTSDVHIRAIANGIEEAMKKSHGVRPVAVQGRSQANWIILDYGDVVTHVFSQAEREYYDLESFWKHARVVERVLAGRPDGAASEASRHSAESGRADEAQPPSAAGDRSPIEVAPDDSNQPNETAHADEPAAPSP